MAYQTKSKETHVCLECGDVIRYGRRDRKFCCLQCKNAYNNKRNRASRNYKMKVMTALDKNYEILNHLVAMKIRAIGLSEIVLMGFNAELSTAYHKVGKHNEYWCYDIKYDLSGTRLFNIARVATLLKSSC